MIFLIEYDRPTRRTLVFKTFKEDQRLEAQDERLHLELELRGQGLLLDREVVLLEALDEHFLRRTHDARRDFQLLVSSICTRSA
jgi:hypothetical protein